MPATARRSKSEAYEKGIREGMAMAKRSRGNKPTEEEEMDMDMKPGHSRKRRKPAADGYGMKKPMDGGMYGKKPMDTECGCGKKKGRKCDGNCGSMRKRSDALTPLEYLTACEMGIQDRSSTYIRARLDTVEARNDLKCGRGAISEGEKCTKGPAQKVQPKQGSKLKTAAKVAATTAAFAGAGYLLGRSGVGPKMGAALRQGKSEVGLATSEIKNAGKYGKTMQIKAAKNAIGNIRGRAKLRAAAKKGAAPQTETMFGRVLDPWASTEGAQLTDKARARRAVRNALKRKRRDSMYADGFSLDSGSFAI